jgi:flagellar hook-associated protein 3 FlgL
MSMRITSGMVQRSVLSDLNRVSSDIAASQRKIGTGKEISKPSDDPSGAALSLKLRTGLAATQQYQRNAQDAQGWQDTAETAMADITDSLQRAQELLVRGGSDSADPAGRAAIAHEIDALAEAVKDSANTTHNGRFVFSGTATNTPPYVAGADDGYKGTSGIISREVGPGVSLQMNVLGSDVIGDGTSGVIATLRGIANHLRSGDGESLRGQDMRNLDAALDGVLDVRALNGARTNRLDSALTRLGQIEENTLTQLSDTEDADLAETLINLNSQQAAYQSALRAGANLVQSSLMDFLR